jgi:hypothetical protein
MVMPGNRWWRVYGRTYPSVAPTDGADAAVDAMPVDPTARAGDLPDILRDFLEERSAEVITLAACRVPAGARQGGPASDQAGEGTAAWRRRDTSRSRWSQTTGVM